MSFSPSSGAPRQQFGGDLLTEIFENSLDPEYAAPTQRGHRSTPLRIIGRIAALMAVGFLCAVAYQKVIADTPTVTRARQELIKEVQTDQSVADKLQSTTERLREEVAVQRDQALTDAGGNAAYLRGLEAATGLGRVRGDGITVTVGDAGSAKDPVTGRPKPGTSGKVYDRDLQRIVNALWSAGAEAIAVNNQRLSGTSTIRAAGGAILVDFQPVSGPYKIAAIGPDDLRQRFDATSTARQFHSYVDQYGMVFGVKQTAKLLLPAAGDPQLRFARPIASAGPTPHSTPSPTGGTR